MTTARSQLVCAWAISCVGLTTASARAGGDEALKALVMKEYPVALERLAKQYSQVHGVAHVKKDRITKGGVVPTSVEATTFFLDGDSWKASTTQTLGNGPYAKVNCQGPTVHFRVVTKAKGDAPSLARFGAGVDPAFRGARESLERNLVAVPFNIGFPISELFTLPGFKFDRVAELQRDGRKLLELVCTLPAQQKLPGVFRECRLVVSPEEGWILREYESKMPKYSSTMRIDYFTATGGPPGIKRILRIDTSSSIANTPMESIEFEEFQFGPTPASEFTLKSVGLPEIDAESPPRESDKTSWWLIGSGVVAAASAAIVRFASRHKAG